GRRGHRHRARPRAARPGPSRPALPAGRRRPARQRPAAAAGRGRPHRMAGPVTPTVLVAEDSLVIRAVLVEQLQSRGYRVLKAADGEQALAACARERPHVVLLDVEMPQLDGHAVLARIKADHLLADIPVVFVTSRVTTEAGVEGGGLGAPGF